MKSISQYHLVCFVLTACKSESPERIWHFNAYLFIDSYALDDFLSKLSSEIVVFILSEINSFVNDRRSDRWMDGRSTAIIKTTTIKTTKTRTRTRTTRTRTRTTRTTTSPTMRPLGVYLIGLSIYILDVIQFLMILGDFGGFA